ncbi:helix-turn-helix domain-containing protein [Streptomyces sp. SL13]|uniref:Helix-turn-helix domain-containing protein n=1 Tax=Streptantibioticus silvisoli TaxID=2705255 RepID=A0AA90KAJ1_9ACTN|nr:helix-turn-helix domain-containing protein [Streptantibioticus silvisoli]MDI5962212.1 helix-turn-helix domain-containing protein [Streptantibioticus silvisoli]MDI5972478.1 helix-turn-helix domain-containing protein [Streptantibioticus silvisoli]
MEPNEPLPQVSLDARNLRGIAHPLRVRILGILRTEGPATASTLSRRLDQNTGATSYHLRQLAEHGFITEVPDRGVRRERWWQAAHANTVVPDSDLLADGGGLGAAFLGSLAQVWADNMLRAVAATPALTHEWRDAQDFGDYAFTLTPEEAKDLMAEFHRVLKRRTAAAAEAGPTEGAARVSFQFQMFPSPEDRQPRTDATETEK